MDVVITRLINVSQPGFSNLAHLPLSADDLSRFPPPYIVLAVKDSFRDDGVVLDMGAEGTWCARKARMPDGRIGVAALEN
jgi:hypothetical protein